MKDFGRKLLCLSAAAVFYAAAASPSASAQFYTIGSDPGSAVWMQITTPSYKIIYPSGLDSLAGVYAGELERWKLPVSRSCGFVPNQLFAKPMPVILHPYTSSANGMVTWVPRRVDLFTVKDAYEVTPTPWEKQLAIHEGRHVAQMQFSRTSLGGPLTYVTGQLFQGAMCAIYCGPHFFEGDAVVAETGLTNTGRGRDASFLEYYRSCAYAGERRDFWQWRYGSWKKYTPNHYALGYITMAGVRSLYDEPLFTNRYYDRIRKYVLPILNFQKTIKEISGKPFRQTFSAICDTLAGEWRLNRELRGPFMPSVLSTSADRRFFTEFDGGAVVGNTLYSIRSGKDFTPELVSLNGDKFKRVRRFPYTHSCLSADDCNSRLVWSESIPDPRWPLRSYSVVRYCTPDGRVKTLQRRTRWYNPAPSPIADVVAVTEYPLEGGSAVCVLDGRDGHVLQRYPAPDSLQVVKAEWYEDELWCICIGNSGSSIRVASGGYRAVVPEVSAKLGELLWRRIPDCIGGGMAMTFTCDRTGVTELYTIDRKTCRIRQLTNLPEGGKDFHFIGDSLYYSQLSPKSRSVFYTEAKNLPVRDVEDFDRVYEPWFASVLSRQEAALAKENTLAPDDSVKLSSPKRYNKLGHLFNIHSWIPFYFNYDAVSSISLETISQNAGLGATAYTQNELGTAYGFVGYQAAPWNGKWKHSGHFNFTYTGLYPVFELGLDFNARDRRKYCFEPDPQSMAAVLTSSYVGSPSLSAHITSYIPFNFSSGGWLRGLIPQAKYSFSTDYFNLDNIQGYSGNHNVDLVSLSVRGYSMLSVPEAGVYPRLGVGAELGWQFYPWLKGILKDNPYAFVYGYLPGIGSSHSIKLSALARRDSWKVTFDYALPFAALDWSFLGPVAYFRNLELIPHVDYTGYWKNNENVVNFGASFAVCLSNLLWIPYLTKIGVTYRSDTGFSFLFSVDI